MLVLDAPISVPEDALAGLWIAVDIGVGGEVVFGLGRSSDLGLALVLRAGRRPELVGFLRGPGPTEFAYADAVKWTSTGPIVFDRAQSRVAILDSVGNLAREVPVKTSVGWPAVLDTDGGLHWLSRGRRTLSVRSWAPDQRIREVETSLRAPEHSGSTIASMGSSSILVFGSVDLCFSKVDDTTVSASPLGCLPSAVTRELGAARQLAGRTISENQRVTLLTGINRPHLSSFGSDSAVLLLDSPTRSGAIGVVVRFVDRTASLVYPEHTDSVGSFGIFTASISASGRLLLSDGAELRFAEIRRSAVLN